jgi:serpin B
MKRVVVLAAVPFAVLLQGCGTDPSGPADPIDALPRPLTVTEQELVSASNRFGFDLFRRVHAAEDGPNVFLSPLSASMALGMILNGAAGETWAGMRGALAFDDLSAEQINASYRSLIDLLTDLDPAVRFDIANSVWAREGFAVLPSFYDVIREYFDGEARTLDFNDPQSLATINGWISEATNGRIEKGIDEISDADLMFLINAIYFNGDWTERFDRGRTQRTAFTRTDGSTVQVDMMTGKVELGYAADPRWTAGELPYGGGAFGMVLVVPRDDVSLDDVVRDFDAAAWDALTARLQESELDVFLPKFRFEYDTWLNDPLIDMGMSRAFSPDADFSALTPGNVCIQFVRQKTFIEVDEEGTEAAAVTVGGVGVTSLPPQLRVDRAFLFAIRERLTGTILFMGTIGDPTVEETQPKAKPAPPC